jgi:hypothetical protein
LLWVEAPPVVIAEMARVTRPGGAVLVLAEPDYGGRIDYPQQLERLGEWQIAALRKQGADPELGRRLAGLLARSGLEVVETGVLGGEWTGTPDRENLDLEWSVVESDFDSLGFGREERETLKRLQDAEWAAWESGERVLFVPTFYGWGRVPA